jgi:hypothetical protein
MITNFFSFSCYDWISTPIWLTKDLYQTITYYDNINGNSLYDCSFTNLENEIITKKNVWSNWTFSIIILALQCFFYS